MAACVLLLCWYLHCVSCAVAAGKRMPGCYALRVQADLPQHIEVRLSVAAPGVKALTSVTAFPAWTQERCLLGRDADRLRRARTSWITTTSPGTGLATDGRGGAALGAAW